MLLKQQEAVKVIQSKLNKISQVKDHLKASNEFKPDFSYDLVSLV